MLSKSRKHLKQFLEANDILSLAEELFEYVPGLLFFVKDRERRFVYVNQGLSDMFGLSRKADIIGKFDTEYSDEYVESMFRKDDDRILKEGISIKNKIELVTTMYGVIKWHITSKVPLYGRDGSIKGLVGVTREFKSDSATSTQHPALIKVIKYIGENFSRPINITQLASIAGLSVSALGRNFKKSFHLTPAQYINRYRISEACILLSEGDIAIAEIATECGFYDQSHFSRTFREIIHATPAAYRKRYR
jgi:PAS domain S-box-containing protein